MTPRTNMSATRVKSGMSQLLTLEVLRSERISPNFVRVTLGGGDVEEFTPMGFDQWFRLFLPVTENSLERLPKKLDTLAYVRYLAISRTERPVLRNYTVRAFRADGGEGPQLDVDFVVHGSADAGTSGPAATWAQTCVPGHAVAIFDEGIAFNPPPSAGRGVVLVADETGLPAAAGILSSLSRDAVGAAVIEVPDAADAQDLDAPEGIEVVWVPRGGGAVPGATALAAARARPVPQDPFYGWVAGEQALATAMRRHWVQSGVPKDNIAFTGYWRAGRH